LDSAAGCVWAPVAGSTAAGTAPAANRHDAGDEAPLVALYDTHLKACQLACGGKVHSKDLGDETFASATLCDLLQVTAFVAARSFHLDDINHAVSTQLLAGSFGPQGLERSKRLLQLLAQLH
jgi:hypothetical protein